MPDLPKHGRVGAVVAACLLLLVVGLELLHLQMQGQLYADSPAARRLMMAGGVILLLALLTGFAGESIRVVPDAAWFRPRRLGLNRAQGAYVLLRGCAWGLALLWLYGAMNFGIKCLALAAVLLLSMRYAVLWQDLRAPTPGKLPVKQRWLGPVVIAYYLTLWALAMLEISPWWLRHWPPLSFGSGPLANIFQTLAFTLPFLGIVLASHVLEFRALGRKVGPRATAAAPAAP